MKITGKNMKWLIDFFTNPFVVNSFAAWVAAQVIKVFTPALIYKEFDIKRIFGDGGMPSAHTATVSSLAILSGLVYGFGSFNFAVCGIYMVIVCRDAVGVRQETGKQNMILNELIKDLKNDSFDEIKLKEFVGHTPLQVVGGIVLGAIVAGLSYWIMF